MNPKESIISAAHTFGCVLYSCISEGSSEEISDQATGLAEHYFGSLPDGPARQWEDIAVRLTAFCTDVNQKLTSYFGDNSQRYVQNLELQHHLAGVCDGIRLMIRPDTNRDWSAKMVEHYYGPDEQEMTHAEFRRRTKKMLTDLAERL